MDQVPAGPATIHVQAATFPEYKVQVDIRSGELSTVIIRLRRGNSLHVTVVDGTNQPIAGELVTLTQHQRGRRRGARTQGDGTCTFVGLPDGTYQLNTAQGKVDQKIRFPRSQQDRVLKRTVRLK